MDFGAELEAKQETVLAARYDANPKKMYVALDELLATIDRYISQLGKLDAAPSRRSLR